MAYQLRNLFESDEVQTVSIRKLSYNKIFPSAKDIVATLWVRTKDVSKLPLKEPLSALLEIFGFSQTQKLVQEYSESNKLTAQDTVPYIDAMNEWQN